MDNIRWNRNAGVGVEEEKSGLRGSIEMMPSNLNDSPVSIELEEVFHIGKKNRQDHKINMIHKPDERRNVLVRKGIVMSVFPGYAAEYRRRHNPIWPELEARLKEHGVLSYSIFLHPQTHQLFAYAEIEDEQRWDSVALTEVCRKWWAHMKEIMPSNPDDSPVSIELEEMFHIEKQKQTGSQD